MAAGLSYHMEDEVGDLMSWRRGWRCKGLVDPARLRLFFGGNWESDVSGHVHICGFQVSDGDDVGKQMWR